LRGYSVTRSPIGVALTFAAVAVALVILTPPAALAVCSNEEVRQQQGSSYLPSCMALELVSPGGKLGASAILPGISADGNRLIFRAKAALADTPGFEEPAGGDWYVASREASGWLTAPTSSPTALNTTTLPERYVFSPNLDRWFSIQSTNSQKQVGKFTVYEANLEKEWISRSPLLSPLDLLNASEIVNGARFDGISEDLSHIVLRPGLSNKATEVAYLSSDPRPTGVDLRARNQYVLGSDPSGSSSLQLLARDEVGPDAGKVWGANCGAWLGGGVVSNERGGRNQGAISKDGTRIYFSARVGQPQALPNEPARPGCITTASGAASLASGSNVLENVVTAKGTGTATEGSNEITAVNTASGAFLVGQTITISGVTVAPGTTITAISGSSLSLSNPVTAGSGTGKGLEAGALPFAAGQRISGPGIPSGTTVIAVNGQSLTLSAAATTTETGVSISAPANPIRILTREEVAGGIEISEAIATECARISPPCSPADGDDYFEGASSDGSKIYFTTTRQLADSDTDTGSQCSSASGAEGCDLYLYDAAKPVGNRLTQVSTGEATASHPVPGSGAGVLKSIPAVSGDGSHVYFVAAGSLTTEPNAAGALPVAGQPNLYVYEPADDRTAFIGTLVPADGGVSYLGLDSSTGGVSTALPRKGDGHILVIQSNAPLTNDDGDGIHTDIFRYDSDGGNLLRVSKAAPGGTDNGAFDAFASALRWASEDGTSIVFTSTEPLAPADIDGEENPFLWRLDNGNEELTHLPGTGVPGANRGTIQPAVSLDGSEVAFVSSRALLPADGDTAADVYVARVGGGFLSPAAAPVCLGEACLSPPLPAPAQPAPGSSTISSSGNVVMRCSAQKRRKTHKNKQKKKGQKKRQSPKRTCVAVRGGK